MIDHSSQENWFEPKEPDAIASPALLIYPHRVEQNIQHLIHIAQSVERLRPHVKTHKLPQIVAMHQARGIQKFKCATIAEAEMLATCGVKDILLAYQPVGPNQQRLINLTHKFPDCRFGCLVDNVKTLRQLAAKLSENEPSKDEAEESDRPLNIWIDIDNGNGRTGIRPTPAAEELAKLIVDAAGVAFAGLHIYDGQFARLPIEERMIEVNRAFEPVQTVVQHLEADRVTVPNIVAGGSPTFPVHALRQDVDLSPGTYSLWDMGYTNACPEEPFVFAAVLMTRVVSKPGPNRLCLDLGHKAVAAENPLENRVRFLNAPDAKFLDQKEEHLVIELPDGHGFEIGDVLYGVPWHVCPTVALYQEANAIDKEGDLIDLWPIAARGRRLEI